MGTKKTLYFVAMLAILGLPFIISQPVFAASGDISQVETFIRNIIKVIAGLAGLVATGFFVVGGFTYLARLPIFSWSSCS